MERTAKSATLAGRSRLGMLLVLVAVVVTACAQGAPTSAPVATATLAPAPSQVAEVAQQSTPYSTRTATPVPPTETPLAPTSTATTARAVTPVPPINTPLAPTSTATTAPTMTTPLPTTTPSPYPTSAHKEYFAQKGRVSSKEPLRADVTGDGVPDFIYVSHVLDCGSCRIQKITVFSGPTAVFDEGSYFEPTVEAIPDGGGFVIIVRKALPGEPLANPTGRIILTYRYNDGRFVLVKKEETRVAAPTPIPPVASSADAARFKRDAEQYMRNMADALLTFAPKNQCGFFGCQAAIYQLHRDLYYEEWGRLYALNGPTLPQQCRELWRRVIALSYEANAYVDAGSQATDIYGRLHNRTNALGVLTDMIVMVREAPGTCR